MLDKRTYRSLELLRQLTITSTIDLVDEDLQLLKQMSRAGLLRQDSEKSWKFAKPYIGITLTDVLDAVGGHLDVTPGRLRFVDIQMNIASTRLDIVNTVTHTLLANILVWNLQWDDLSPEGGGQEIGSKI